MGGSGGGGAVGAGPKSLQLSHLLCLKDVSLPPYYLPTEIWGAANVWGGWPETSYYLLSCKTIKSKFKWGSLVWAPFASITTYPCPFVLVKAVLVPTSKGSCWWSHSWFVPAALWLASLFFPPWLTESLSFSGDVSCCQDKLDLRHFRLAVVFLTGVPFLPLSSGCLLLPLVTESPLRSILILSRPAVFFSLEEQVNRKFALGFYVCSVGIQEEINLWV